MFGNYHVALPYVHTLCVLYSLSGILFTVVFVWDVVKPELEDSSARTNQSAVTFLISTIALWPLWWGWLVFHTIRRVVRGR